MKNIYKELTSNQILTNKKIINFKKTKIYTKKKYFPCKNNFNKKDNKTNQKIFYASIVVNLNKIPQKWNLI